MAFCPPSSEITPLWLHLSESGLRREGTKCLKIGDYLYTIEFNEIGKAKHISSKQLKHWKRSLDNYPVEVEIAFHSQRSPEYGELIAALNCKPALKAYAEKKYDEHQCDVSEFIKYDALCLSGGGARGVGFCGVFKQLGNERLVNRIKEVSGSSIGALAAIPIACGMNVEEVSTFFSEYDAELNPESIIRNAQEAIRRKLNPFVIEIHNFLARSRRPLLDSFGNALSLSESTSALNNLSFEQLELLRNYEGEQELPNVSKLKLKRLVLVATSDKKEVELSAKKTPSMSISLAARASCGFPVKIGKLKVNSSVFTKRPNILFGKNSKTVSLSDGGITNNTPYFYLEGERKLVIAFKTAQARIEKERLSVKEFAYQTLLRTPVFEYEKFDIEAAKKDPSVILFFLRSSLKTLDLDMARSDFHLIELDAMRQFQQFEKDRAISLSSYLANLGSYTELTAAELSGEDELERVSAELNLCLSLEESGDEADTLENSWFDDTDREGTDEGEDSYDVSSASENNSFYSSRTTASSVSSSISPLPSPFSETTQSFTNWSSLPRPNSLEKPRIKKSSTDEGFDLLCGDSKVELRQYKVSKYSKGGRRPLSATRF
ncbi:hypothetical protein D5R81_14965 [Parashewanella spongiae]|uniref:PNPLA domain-containing protein n=1 Tax=Parashewanella spongiae TaxID=342950 RepID=A0A3A6TI96_9GAMM|nr:patatin-like phospholipase family protein [Parashewanella spongiae]MCL1079262.1 patatin-like phospholipase family protein [Parashewanella spongiae]RJY07897.1 hypothetical protein D5R81_14965 [Parashewanella spongiae]